MITHLRLIAAQTEERLGLDFRAAALTRRAERLEARARAEGDPVRQVELAREALDCYSAAQRLRGTT